MEDIAGVTSGRTCRWRAGGLGSWRVPAQWVGWRLLALSSHKESPRHFARQFSETGTLHAHVQISKSRAYWDCCSCGRVCSERPPWSLKSPGRAGLPAAAPACQVHGGTVPFTQGSALPAGHVAGAAPASLHLPCEQRLCCHRPLAPHRAATRLPAPHTAAAGNGLPPDGPRSHEILGLPRSARAGVTEPDLLLSPRVHRPIFPRAVVQAVGRQCTCSAVGTSPE